MQDACGAAAPAASTGHRCLMTVPRQTSCGQGVAALIWCCDHPWETTSMLRKANLASWWRLWGRQVMKKDNVFYIVLTSAENDLWINIKGCIGWICGAEFNAVESYLPTLISPTGSGLSVAGDKAGELAQARIHQRSGCVILQSGKKNVEYSWRVLSGSFV